MASQTSSSSRPAMSALTEYCLTAVWKFRPDAVRRIIERMSSGIFPDLEIKYDYECHWFHVKSRPEDRTDIYQEFGNVTSEIEVEAFGKSADKILNEDGTIKLSFDNDLVAYDPGALDSDRVENALEPYSFPAAFADLPHTATWTRLENDRLAIHNLLNADDLDQLQAEWGVLVDTTSHGKMVYIGGNDLKSVQEVKKKFDVLLAIKKLPPTQVQHLLYAEDYVEKVSTELTADIRYMANIHPNLPSSTLLDPACVPDLAKAYKGMYQQGASIRLCQYDQSRGQHYSILGPEIKGFGGKRSFLGNRPVDFAQTMDSLHPPNKRPGIDRFSSSHRIILASETDKEAQVSKWIEGIPESLDSDLSHQGIPNRIGGDYQDAADPDVVGASNADGSVEGIIDSLRSAVVSAAEVQSGALPTPISVVAKGTWEKSLDEDRPITLATFGGQGAPQRPERMESETTQSLSGLLQPTKSTCGIPMAKPQQEPPITWNMRPLVPESVSVAGKNEASVSLATGGQENRFKRHDEPDAKRFNTMNQQTKRLRPKLPFTPPGPSVPKFAPQNPRPQEFVPKTQRVVVQEFMGEIDEAMSKLLVSCPYVRGKVTVRADFGRAVLAGIDQSALAFNNATSASNGWPKTRLMEELKTQMRDLHFTKVLSTYGCDLEHMIGITDDQSQNCLWQTTPHKAWITYSFHCRYANKGAETPFVVECKYGQQNNNFTYEITYGTPVTPIYIHGLLRNWDLRITLTRTNTADLERHFGTMVKDLLGSLHVSKLKTEGTELKFVIDDNRLSVREVRILTKWRYLSGDEQSILEITEVEPLVVTPVTEDKMRQYTAQSPSMPQKMSLSATGFVPRWYEASVLSVEAERHFKDNESLGLGEKADWDVETLKKRGVFGATYGPALQMLKKMDQVGGNDKNKTPRCDVLKPNDKKTIPGNTPASSAPAPSATTQTSIHW